MKYQIETNHDLLRLIIDICNTQIIMTSQVNSKRGVTQAILKEEKREFTALVKHLFPSMSKEQISEKVKQVIAQVS